MVRDIHHAFQLTSAIEALEKVANTLKIPDNVECGKMPDTPFLENSKAIASIKAYLKAQVLGLLMKVRTPKLPDTDKAEGSDSERLGTKSSVLPSKGVSGS